MKIARILAVMLSTLIVAASSAMAADINTLMTKTLTAPDNQVVKMLTVTLAPGEATPPHRHNAYTLVYMLQGTLDMQLKGSRLVELKPGQTFYESPQDVHLVSRNPSKTEPAKILVVFVKQSHTPVLIPLPQTK